MSSRLPLLGCAVIHASVLVACSGNEVCTQPSSTSLPPLPELLSQTGLYADIAADVTAAGVLAFAPQFTLWSDGADKRRWIWLPEGTDIDTSDMDFWQFPEGTRLWKEFVRDGIRVETRLLQKVGPAPADWTAMAYVWNPEQSDAVAAPEGAIDAHGTPHNVPAAGECFGCHGGTASRVLGFSAIQLAHDAEAGLVDLADLDAMGLLTRPPPDDLTVPGNEIERAALGYLHANCGHCHNQRRPTDAGLRCFDPDNRLDFWLRLDRMDAPETTRTYESAIGFAVAPGDPDGSLLIAQVSSRNIIDGMPALGTEEVDREAVQLLRRWIREMAREMAREIER